MVLCRAKPTHGQQLFQALDPEHCAKSLGEIIS